MRLKIHHVTSYRFVPPMRGVVQSHRLVPAPTAAQTVLDWTVRVEGATIGAAFTDGAGNVVQTMSMTGPVEAFTVEVEGQVETSDTSGVLRGPRELVPPLAWLRSTRPTRPDLALADLAASVAGPGDASELDRAHALMAAVADAVRYEPGRTHAATTAAEAMAEGAGVCQDQAHTLIAVALIAGMPARYVTGYLMTGGQSHATMAQDSAEQALDAGQMVQSQGQGQQSQATEVTPGEASHAWAEVWIEKLGWVGFDAANRCCPDDRYLRLACGFDAEHAAPIRGVAQGVGEELMEVHVTVEEASA